MMASIGVVLCLVLLPFSGGVLVIPAGIALPAVAYRFGTRRKWGRTPDTAKEDPTGRGARDKVAPACPTG